MKYCDLKSLSEATSLSVYTLRKFAKMGMPHFKVGRKMLVNPEEFKTWFEIHHKTSPEVKNLEQIINKSLSEVGI